MKVGNDVDRAKKKVLIISIILLKFFHRGEAQIWKTAYFSQ